MITRDPEIVPLFLIACTCFFVSCRLPEGLPDAAPPLRAWFVDVGQGDACLLRELSHGGVVQRLVGLLETAGQRPRAGVGIAVSPDQHSILTGGMEGDIRLWETGSPD